MAYLDTPTASHVSNTQLKGFGYGLLAAAAWSLYTVASRSAVDAGFSALDLTSMRFVVAGLVFLPLLLRKGIRNLGGIGWTRGLLLSLGAGPLFSLLYVYGLSETPYTHGPVLSPSVVTLASIALAAMALGETISISKLLGASVVILGLYLVVSGGSNLFVQASAYDLLFIASGILWAVYTVLLRKWRLDPVLATASVALVSGLAMLPVLVLSADWSMLSEDMALTVFHASMQGVVAAGIAIVAFSRSVLLLGASKAGLFPSLVPILAVLLGVPFLGEVPGVVQSLGVAMATVGLLLTTFSR